MAESLRELRRALLMSSMVTRSGDPGLYRAVVGHREQLRQWFRDRLGWPLVIDTTDGFARLRITPTSMRHGQVQADHRPHRRMGRLAWTVAMLACASMAESDRPEMYASDLRDTITGYTRDRDDLPDVDFTDDHTHRRALAAALSWLDRVGVVDFRDGTADDVSDGGEAIVAIRAAALREMLTSPTKPAAAERSDDLLTDPSAAIAGRHPSVGVLRRLAVEHAVYDTDLDAAELDWLRSNLGVSMGTIRRFADEIGCAVERRTDGVALIDRDDNSPLAPRAFPAAGSTPTHVALIIAEHLADALRTDAPAVARDHLVDIVADSARTIGASAKWAAAARDPANAATTLADGLAVLRSFDLLVETPSTVTGRPLVARFGADPVAMTQPTPMTLDVP